MQVIVNKSAIYGGFMPLITGALGIWNKVLFGTIIANTAISVIGGITNIAMAASTRPKQESETIETIDVDMTTMVGAKTPYANIYYLGS